MTKKQNTATQKSASITLRAPDGSALVLAAVRKPDGTIVTTVTTRNPQKQATRGMSETHKNMDAAKAHLATLAKSAEKAGWKRGTFGAVVRPDAFSSIPPAPKASTADEHGRA
jgi:hypothetical protein